MPNSQRHPLNLYLIWKITLFFYKHEKYLILTISFVFFLKRNAPSHFIEKLQRKIFNTQRLCHKLGFVIPISLKPNVVDRRYFKLWTLVDQTSLKYERYASSGCWDFGIVKLEFVTKTQFLSKNVCKNIC